MFPFDYVATTALPEAFEFCLDDGTPALLRHLKPEDAPRLRQGFEALSQLARRRRFGLEMDVLPQEMIRRLTRADGTHIRAWGAANLQAPEEPGIGIARYERNEEEPDSADVAIVILDEYMNRGAGVLLHACLHRDAYQAGIRHFYYDVVAENSKFIKHLRSLGAEYVGRSLGVTRLKCRVYGNALSVPHIKPNARRFAQSLRRLASVKPSQRILGQLDEQVTAPW